MHNLPWHCTWQQLKDLFKEWKVERADIVVDQYGRSRCEWVLDLVCRDWVQGCEGAHRGWMNG